MDRSRVEEIDVCMSFVFTFSYSFVCFFPAFKYLTVEVDIAIAFGRSKNKAITTHEKKKYNAQTKKYILKLMKPWKNKFRTRERKKNNKKEMFVLLHCKC